MHAKISASIFRLAVFGMAGFIALTLTTILSARPVNAQTEVYERVNNQTIKFYYSPDAGNENVSSKVKYFISDEPVPPDYATDGYANAKAEGAIFKNVTDTSACEDFLFLTTVPYDINTGSLSRYVVPRKSGACDENNSTVSTITNYVDNGSRIFFYKDAEGDIKPALSSAEAVSFIKLKQTSGLGLSDGEAIYYPASINSKCPALLFQYNSKSWGLMAPVEEQDGTYQDSAGSRYYRSIMANVEGFDNSNIGVCNAGTATEVNISGEKALASIFGNDKNFWVGGNGYTNISFHDITGAVKILGNAVGDESAAEILLGTNPPGTTDALAEDKADELGDGAAPACAIAGVGGTSATTINKYKNCRKVNGPSSLSSASTSCGTL